MRSLHGSISLLMASMWWACAGSSPMVESPDSAEITTDDSYMRFPREYLGGEWQLEDRGDMLIHCYESEQEREAEQIPAALVNLVFTGAGVQVEATQQSYVSDRLNQCIERATLSWDVTGELASESEIIPLEFGTLDPTREEPDR